MKPKKQPSESPKVAPWQDRLGDDFRPSLQKLEAAQWNPEVAFSLFYRPLSEVISRLHFNSHQRWGLLPDPEEIRHLSKEFLQWMNRAARWEEMKSALSEAPTNAPVKYFLARYFVRFQKDLPLKGEFSKNQPSYSSKRSLLDMSQASDLSRQVAESTMSAFASMTQQLPQKNRLPYDLHLEGLLNNEIAWIINQDAKVVEALIKEAKEYLLGIASGGESRREGT